MAIKATPAAPHGGRKSMGHSPKASPNPSRAESRANLKTTFGTPKKQK